MPKRAESATKRAVPGWTCEEASLPHKSPEKVTRRARTDWYRLQQYLFLVCSSPDEICEWFQRNGALWGWA